MSSVKFAEYTINVQKKKVNFNIVAMNNWKLKFKKIPVIMTSKL